MDSSVRWSDKVEISMGAIMKKVKAISTILLMLLFSGCATTYTVKNEPLAAGYTQAFKSDISTISELAYQGAINTGIKIKSNEALSEDQWMIIGTTPPSMWSYGEIVRIIVESRTDSSSVVSVQVKVRLATNIFAKTDYHLDIFQYIQNNI